MVVGASKTPILLVVKAPGHPEMHAKIPSRISSPSRSRRTWPSIWPCRDVACTMAQAQSLSHEDKSVMIRACLPSSVRESAGLPASQLLSSGAHTRDKQAHRKIQHNLRQYRSALLDLETSINHTTQATRIHHPASPVPAPYNACPSNSPKKSNG
ncbi:hypothetical protein N658DRAFT_183426 [Parathielavia hyrcaniae]|uniref:Uncharacterized protein n=1 Tax=Parathielavia hyrcaniae TaxID=113614 RepID=A0AAN6T5C6_9PEZI|nr:hypothetical protein N658DRAFT_183426 [Parathielavia hyrcaniae]